jgi:uncharacterized protein (TIGR03435 family)
MTQEGSAVDIVDHLTTSVSLPGKRLILVCGLCLLTAFDFSAQEKPKARRQFAVTAIKSNHSGLRRLQAYDYSPGGRFSATNATLVDMIVSAYPTRRIQMQGGPDWIDSERFDVIAKADPDDGEVKSDQWAQMVQVFLEDRFKLRFHTETREMEVLALVAGKTAPKLEASKDDEKTAFIPGERGQIIFQKMPIAGLVNTMANILHTPVVDRTGLTGFFNFKLDPNQFAVQDGTDGTASQDSRGDLIITAVREQLGFRLEKQRASLEITIIDHAERPGEN